MLGNKALAKCITNTAELTPYVKAVRKVYATGLQSNVLKAAVPRVHGVLDKMNEIIEQQRSTGGAVELQALCVKMTLDVIGVVAFDTTLGGLDGGSALYQGIIDVGHYLSTQSLNPFKALYRTLFPNSKVAQEYRASLHQLTAEYDKLTKEIIAREDAPGEDEPIWAGLKRFIDPETGEPLLYDSFLTEVALVVMSGMDTTGHQLAWILALLASNPDKVEKLMEELKSRGLSGENARNATFADLAELPYLTAIIKEGMRIAHAVFGPFIRSVPHDMSILGYRVPAGTVIIFPSTRLMCAEAEWGDPDVFRPERWLSGEDMSQKLCLGFSYGPRDCIGQRLAMMEMRMAVIRLVAKFKFSATVPFDDLMNKVSNGVAIEAKDGVWLNVAERDHAV